MRPLIGSCQWFPQLGYVTHCFPLDSAKYCATGVFIHTPEQITLTRRSGAREMLGLHLHHRSAGAVRVRAGSSSGSAKQPDRVFDMPKISPFTAMEKLASWISVWKQYSIYRERTNDDPEGSRNKFYLDSTRHYRTIIPRTYSRVIHSHTRATHHLKATLLAIQRRQSTSDASLKFNAQPYIPLFSDIHDLSFPYTLP